MANDAYDEIEPVRRPKHIDKKKHHRKGFSESSDHQVVRKQRVGFKQYLREIEEQELEDDLDLVDEDMDGDE